MRFFINANYCSIVLTASHCIVEQKQNNIEISVGRSTVLFDSNAQTASVQTILPHEDYTLDPNEIQPYHDVGLLLLETPLNLNQHVQPIAWTNSIDYEKPLTTYGWGSTDAFENHPSYYLQAKNVSLIPDNLCIDMLNKAITKCTKQAYEICAEKSLCYGDSGKKLNFEILSAYMLHFRMIMNCNLVTKRWSYRAKGR